MIDTGDVCWHTSFSSAYRGQDGQPFFLPGLVVGPTRLALFLATKRPPPGLRIIVLAPRCFLSILGFHARVRHEPPVESGSAATGGGWRLRLRASGRRRPEVGGGKPKVAACGRQEREKVCGRLRPAHPAAAVRGCCRGRRRGQAKRVWMSAAGGRCSRNQSHRHSSTMGASDVRWGQRRQGSRSSRRTQTKPRCHLSEAADCQAINRRM